VLDIGEAHSQEISAVCNPGIVDHQVNSAEFGGHRLSVGQHRVAIGDIEPVRSDMGTETRCLGACFDQSDFVDVG